MIRKSARGPAIPVREHQHRKAMTVALLLLSLVAVGPAAILAAETNLASDPASPKDPAGPKDAASPKGNDGTKGSDSTEDLEAQMEAARARLEEAAHEVAELSAEMGRPLMQKFITMSGEGPSITPAGLVAGTADSCRRGRR